MHKIICLLMISAFALPIFSAQQADLAAVQQETVEQMFSSCKSLCLSLESHHILLMCKRFMRLFNQSIQFNDTQLIELNCIGKKIDDIVRYGTSDQKAQVPHGMQQYIYRIQQDLHFYFDEKKQHEKQQAVVSAGIVAVKPVFVQEMVLPSNVSVGDNSSQQVLVPLQESAATSLSFSCLPQNQHVHDSNVSSVQYNVVSPVLATQQFDVAVVYKEKVEDGLKKLKEIFNLHGGVLSQEQCRRYLHIARNRDALSVTDFLDLFKITIEIENIVSNNQLEVGLIFTRDLIEALNTVTELVKKTYEEKKQVLSDQALAVQSVVVQQLASTLNVSVGDNSAEEVAVVSQQSDVISVLSSHNASSVAGASSQVSATLQGVTDVEHESVESMFASFENMTEKLESDLVVLLCKRFVALVAKCNELSDEQCVVLNNINSILYVDEHYQVLSSGGMEENFLLARTRLQEHCDQQQRQHHEQQGLSAPTAVTIGEVQPLGKPVVVEPVVLAHGHSTHNVSMLEQPSAVTSTQLSPLLHDNAVSSVPKSGSPLLAAPSAHASVSGTSAVSSSASGSVRPASAKIYQSGISAASDAVYKKYGSVSQVAANIVGLGATLWYVKHMYMSKKMSFAARAFFTGASFVAFYKYLKNLCGSGVQVNSANISAVSVLYTTVLATYFGVTLYNKALLTKKNAIFSSVELFLQPVLAHYLAKHSLYSVGYAVARLAKYIL